MGKKKNNDSDDEEAGCGAGEAPVASAPQERLAPVEKRGILPALSVGDILALLTLIVLSAALLLEGYHNDYKNYSKEIIALFAVVVGFLLGRKA
jgi:hypothetical protein